MVQTYITLILRNSRHAEDNVLKTENAGRGGGQEREQGRRQEQGQGQG